METKANYALIGLFTLGGILGALGLLLWLAKVEVDQQYAYYDILFEDVSGLGAASDVRYNGLPVGQVVDLDLDADDPSQVRVRIEVSADAPVNSETRARLQSQGVTGVSFVGLTGGSEAADPLASGATIPSERTALQSVFEGAPELLSRAIVLLENVNDVFNDDNKAAVGTLVSNLATSSERLDGVLANFETLSDDLGNAAREIAAFTGRLEQLSDTAETTLSAATVTLGDVSTLTTESLAPLAEDLRLTSRTATDVIASAGADVTRIAGRIDGLAARGETVLDSATTTLDSANTAMQSVAALADTQLGPLADDVRATAQTATRVLTDVGGEAARVVGRFDAVADSAILALGDAQTTLKSVDQAATGFDRLMTDQLSPLADDLRTTSQTATRVIDDVGTRTAALATRLDALTTEASGALDTFTTTFNNANDTLGWVTTAMTGATETLDIASRTFANANKVIQDDIGGILDDLRAAASTFASTFSESSDGVIGDLRQAASTFTNTVQNASQNIDAVSNEVLAASRSAASFAKTLDEVVSGNERQISEFLRLGLPEFLRFTEEARSLTVNLERLVNKIERDPGRFLLGTQNSRFRR
ncbi:MlaD family protein [uncultured Tateyamaria sp.]|uniref:MlaD family protein n=1 Tax=uncultured Tateyamaria sp. TaxID=455651 RepID=UPI002624C55D|nr:MlaD family protein [uncultured Tateyamaria sp.]